MKWIVYGGIAYFLYRWWQGQQNVTVAQPVDDSGAPLDLGGGSSGGFPMPVPGPLPSLPPGSQGVPLPAPTPIPHPTSSSGGVPMPRPGSLVLRSAIVAPGRNISGIGRI